MISVQEGSVQGGLCPGGLGHGDCPGMVEERVVCILVACILFLNKINKNLFISIFYLLF